MASNDDNSGIVPVPILTGGDHEEPASPTDEKKVDFGTADVRPIRPESLAGDGLMVKDAHQSVGLSVIEQITTIPQTGQRMITSRMEYILYIFYCTEKIT